ncbi:SymE family type I addiction module toxin [Lonsdalea quercina]|uniref:SymE family type I addiction module toxin n=2 Tax=Lonsdalea quercina TaxID=71657 RepID=UPI0039765A50
MPFCHSRTTRSRRSYSSCTWLQEAGFSTGQPLKLRVMPGCIVITVQDLRELWHCLEGLSLQPFDERSAAEWLRRFPGGLDMAGITDNN